MAGSGGSIEKYWLQGSLVSKAWPGGWGLCVQRDWDWSPGVELGGGLEMYFSTGAATEQKAKECLSAAPGEHQLVKPVVPGPKQTEGKKGRETHTEEKEPTN